MAIVQNPFAAAKGLIKARSPVWYGRLRRVLQSIRRWRHTSRIVEHRYCGHVRKIWLADACAQAWYDSDWPEMAEIAVLKTSRLRGGARVFDLGAHHGVVALILAGEVGETGQVVAVEADPFAFRVLKRNKELNSSPQLHVVHAAIQSHSGSLSDPVNGRAEASDRLTAWGDQRVSALSLDDMTRRFGLPDVVFVDVDGFDCHVLRGGRETLAGKPDYFIEVHVKCGLEAEGGSVAEVLSFFPQDVWNLRIASDEAREFVPFSPHHPLLSSRFFLIATAKKGP